MTEPPVRTVTLRHEREGRDSRRLWAYVSGDGSLHIDGQDLGPATAPVSSDGEYEWFTTVAAEHVPRLLELLGAAPAGDILDVLKERFTGVRSYDLERILRGGDVPVERYVYGA